MALSSQQKKGLLYLQELLSKVYVPDDTNIEDVIFKKQDGQVTKVFQNGPSVYDITDADPHEVYEDPEIAAAAQRAYDMWNPAPDNAIYFINSPDGKGIIELDQNGIKPLTVNNKPVTDQEIAHWSDLEDDLRDLLSTFQEEESGNLIATKADLTNHEVWSRLMQKDDEGNYQPLVVDPSKFASDTQQDRLQAIANMEKIIQGNNLYLRDEDGTVSKVEAAPNGKLFRGEYDRESVKNVVTKEHTVIHGPVSMFFMRMFQSIGIHWFDGLIAEQEEAELKDEFEYIQNIEKHVADRRKVIDQIKMENVRDVDIGKDAMLPPSWDMENAMQNVMLDPKSKIGTKIGKLRGAQHSATLLGMFAGALSAEYEADKVMKLLDGVTSGKNVWEDPEMAEFLQKGLDKYLAAKNSLGKKEDPHVAAQPMKDILKAAAGKMALYAGNMVPLDHRAVILSDITKGLIKMTKETPTLKYTFITDLESVRGVLALGQLVEDGLTAQYNLANKHTTPEEMQRDMSDYLAYKTAEQIILVDAAYNAKKVQGDENVKALPDNAPTFLQIIGGLGTKSFQKVFLQSDFGKKALGTVNWEEVHEFKDLARDGYLNGNRAKIVKIAREAAMELGKMYFDANPRLRGTDVVEYRRNPYTPEQENQKSEDPTLKAPQKSGM